MEKTYFISGVFRFLTKKRVVYPAIILIIVLGAVAIFRDGNGRELSVVVRADIIQEVAATGKVKPAQTVDLGFDKSGRVSAVYFDVGDCVSRGEVIASLESADLFADIAKAKASLEEETIKLREIKNTAPVNETTTPITRPTIIKREGGSAVAPNTVVFIAPTQPVKSL